MEKHGRSGGIRTHDPFTPSKVRYQAALRSDSIGYTPAFGGRQFSFVSTASLKQLVISHGNGRLIANKVMEDAACTKRTISLSGNPRKSSTG